MLERGGDSVGGGEWGVTANAPRDAETSRGRGTPHPPLRTRLGLFAMRVLAAVSLLFPITACHFAPRHVQPPLPTPVAYDATPGPTAGTRAVDIGWRDFFADPRLEALIAAALVHNRDL